MAVVSAQKQDTATYILWVNDERTVLVRMWVDGNVEVATREDRHGIWGPPVKCKLEAT